MAAAMSFGLVIKGGNNATLLDSSAYPVFLLGRGSIEVGEQPTVFPPTGFSQASVVVWPLHTDSGFVLKWPKGYGWYRGIGPWRWHQSPSSAGTALSYPDMRWYDWQYGNHTSSWQNNGSSLSGAEYDVFGNV